MPAIEGKPVARLPRSGPPHISVHLRASMVATGRFVTTFPRSVLDLHADRLGLKMLPINLPNARWPVKIATLKNRSSKTVGKGVIARGGAIAKSGLDKEKAHPSK